ncbi:MAG: TIGR01548 family HAD-type hydrolase [Myxococcales bacterium]|nr:TIGR01548 family HAD-type hydrolase [Myxococcales bacterium]
MSQLLRPSNAVLNTSTYSPYKHLAPIDLKLDANEGPPLPISISNALADISIDTLRRYPSTQDLCQRLAKRFKISPNQLLVTAGADDALDRACRAFLGPGSELIYPTPSFEMIPRFAQWAYGTVLNIDWSQSKFPLSKVVDLISERTKLISLVSPNNPTGATVTSDELIALSKAAPKALILLDHAYVEFVDRPELDLSQLALSLDNVCIFRTFSKAWGLAACRVGYVMGPERVIGWLKQVGHPYSVSTLSANLVHRALSDSNKYISESVTQVQKERFELSKLLKCLEGNVTDSQGNFVFYQGPQAKWIYDALAGLGIAVRTWSKDSRLANAIRITCPGQQKGFERLTKALQTALDPQAILFDLDGVIADVSESYRAAIIGTAASYGVEIHDRDIAMIKACGDANNDWRVTQTLLHKHGLDVSLAEVTERFERLYQGEEFDSQHSPRGLYLKETMIPTRETLIKLCEGRKTAIVTGRPLKDALIFLERFNLTDLFQELITMEDAPAKPDPAPVKLALSRLGVERAWMIGDTVDDVRAARHAQVIPIGVLIPKEPEPFFTRKHLETAGAARVVENITEIQEWLR